MSEPQATPPPTAAAPAQQRFELVSRIGAGNHGVVFRAHDRQLGRDVAIKRFSHFLADDPRAMRRITREVETLARVSHPNVVTIHDLIQMPDGDGEITPHLVMELAEGTSLRDLLAEYGPSPRSVVVVRAVLQGLSACHAAGILHLDIKPANVLVTARGGVKIVDFGIARAASDATATIAGTPHYMAPEQAEGRVDERSDVYSVGCLLYECLTGRPPFEGTMAAQLMAHRHQPRPDPRRLAPHLSPGLAAVVMRAMATDPGQRFSGVDEMLAALTAQPPPSAAPTPQPTPRPAPAVVPQDRPAPRPGEPPGPSRVTSWDRMATFAAGLAMSALAVMAIPALAAAVGELAPVEYRPESMRASGSVWWMAAVTIALLVLLLRRREFFGRLAGPEAGTPRQGVLIGPSTRSGVRMAVGAGLRGASILLFGWYVLGVATASEALELPWPPEVFASPWSIGWVLLPLLAFVLLWRAVTRLRRPSLGALLGAFLCVCGAAVAALLFLAVPEVAGSGLWDALG